MFRHGVSTLLWDVSSLLLYCVSLGMSIGFVYFVKSNVCTITGTPFLAIPFRKKLSDQQISKGYLN